MVTVPAPYQELRWPTAITELEAKERLAAKAVDHIVAELSATGPSDRVLGVGSGSTAFLVVRRLAAMLSRLGQVRAVATSYEMEWYAQAAGLFLCDASSSVVAFDGADYVTPAGVLVKGRGGAMRRERAVLSGASLELIVTDATKSTPSLQGVLLPLELDPRSAGPAMAELTEHLGTSAVLRSGPGKDGPTVSESGGVLADIRLGETTLLNDELDDVIRSVRGVRDTGYFAASPKRVLID